MNPLATPADPANFLGLAGQDAAAGQCFEIGDADVDALTTAR